MAEMRLSCGFQRFFHRYFYELVVELKVKLNNCKYRNATQRKLPVYQVYVTGSISEQC
jgi:hypothetical protein